MKCIKTGDLVWVREAVWGDDMSDGIVCSDWRPGLVIDDQQRMEDDFKHFQVLVDGELRMVERYQLRPITSEVQQ